MPDVLVGTLQRFLVKLHSDYLRITLFMTSLEYLRLEHHGALRILYTRYAN